MQSKSLYQQGKVQFRSHTFQVLYNLRSAVSSHLIHVVNGARRHHWERWGRGRRPGVLALMTRETYTSDVLVCVCQCEQVSAMSEVLACETVGSRQHHASRSVRVSDVQYWLCCTLCGGYLIDATTISRCLHTCEFQLLLLVLLLLQLLLLLLILLPLEQQQ